jgi:hypothetical protein
MEPRSTINMRDNTAPPGTAKVLFAPGQRVQALWKDDGLWYDATVVLAAPDSTFMVDFDGFEGQSESVTLDQLREPVLFAPAHKKKEDKTYTTPAGYVIPERLRIDKGKDSEAVIEQKKRKLHQVKSQQRSERQTEEASQSKQKWQDFQKKMGRR